ncbi:hypothetical protein BGX21_002884 [Mortierella sp. AD011]|nr:hypothetical protein BGX20_006338 [Mortierella sp. AD010]KAF9378534.1 hypothetical protein BGX21_002884 [Mortierella sp. AD011]
MSRRRQDPIAEHSDRLCEHMNGHPAIVLSYARYFGEYPDASSATIVAVDQDGFDITCQDNGEEREVRVTFGRSMHAVSQVKDAFMTLAREAETALRGNDPSGQGLMPDSPSPTLPHNLFDTILLLIALTIIYLDFFPNTTSPLLQWILETSLSDRASSALPTSYNGGLPSLSLAIHVYSSSLTLP